MPAIQLVPFGEQHLPGLRLLLADPGVRRYTRVPDPVPDGFDRTWVERYERGRADSTRMNFAIEDSDDNTFLGVAVAPHLDHDERTAELGYVVRIEARGRGVANRGPAAADLLGVPGAGHVPAPVLISVSNDASKRVAQRCGYRFEGVLRGLYVKQDQREDTESWSRLVTDT